jgi:hypothetical protein
MIYHLIAFGKKQIRNNKSGRVIRKSDQIGKSN